MALETPSRRGHRGTGLTKESLAGTGTTRQRNRRRRYNVAVPYAPTAKGKHAEEVAKLRGRVFHAATTQTGGFDPLGTVGSLSDRFLNLNLGGSPVGSESNPARSLAQEEAKNLLEVAKQNYPGLFGGSPSLRNVLPHAPDAQEVQAAAAITAPVPIGKAAQAGEAAQTLADALKATRAGEKVAQDSGAVRGLLRNPIRRGVARAAQKAEPEFVKAARQAAAKRAAALPTSVKVAGKVGGQAVSYPVKHPITAPFALQAPVALMKGNPSALLEPLHGKGVEASIASAAGHLGSLPGEAVSLPASVLPTAYLIGQAALNAAQGNTKDWDELKKQYLATGVLPALLKGSPSEALKRLGEHPLYGGLELSGAASVAGRGLGAIAREATGGAVGGIKRADLPIRGTTLNVKRRYSPDLIRQAFQRAYDRTPVGREVRPDTLRGRHYLKEAANRFESGQEAIRKQHSHEDMLAIKKSLPKRFGRIDHKAAEVVNLAVERIIRHPETFSTDLPKYRKALEVAAKELGPDGKPALDRYQLEHNKALIKQIKAAEGIGADRIHATVGAANEFIALQQPILQEMVDLKLIDPAQAAKASAVSFARVHMGSDYGVPAEKRPIIAEKISRERELAAAVEKAHADHATPEVIKALEEEHGKAIRSIRNAEDRHSQHIDQHGNALSLGQITAEMQRQGIEPPGFLSHRPPSAGDFYKPNFEGAKLEPGARTGESVATGSQLGGVEALVRQIRRSQGLVDRARAWNTAVTRFGLKVPEVKTWADAKRVLRDPARYGLDPATQPAVVPRYPFMAKKAEIQGALEHQNPDFAGETASGILSKAIDEAKAGNLPDNTPVVFMPGKVVQQLRLGTAPAGDLLRSAQAMTTLFTRTVLPFSPGWYIGNGLDNALRTFAAGMNNPVALAADQIRGHVVRKALTPEQQAELLAGAHYSSVAALNPHRNVESLVRGYDRVSKAVRAAAEWEKKGGPAQMVVKAGPTLLGKTSDLFINVNKFLTEDLPQRGALGKLAAEELKATQGSWLKALIHQKEIAKDFQRKIVNPDNMVKFQKDLEEVYGNYTRMSPRARLLLRNISPFWAWFRAAYKFVYVTMPVHHPILTGALTAGSRATQPIREEYGLDTEGEHPLPSFMQGGIPLKGGGEFPAASYTSFGYAANPVESVGRLPFPQFQGVVEALRGRDWKGDPLKGGEGNKVLTALWTLATAFVPGAPLFAKENQGKRELGPTLPSFPHPYDAGYVRYKRTPTQTITVPKSEGSSSSGSSGFVQGYSSHLSGSGSSGGFVKGYAERLGE